MYKWNETRNYSSTIYGAIPVIQTADTGVIQGRELFETWEQFVKASQLSCKSIYT